MSQRVIITQDENGNDPSFQLTGRKVIETVFQNGLAITDTANHDIQIDVSAVSGRKYVIVQNSLNQSITVTLLGKSSIGGGLSSLGSKSCTSLNSIFITTSDIANLLDPLQLLTIRVACATAPTSGAVSTWLEGVQA